MSKTTIHLMKPHPNQRKILDSRARFRVVACGRRFGKTEVGKRAIVTRAQDGSRCWWLSPTYSMASQVWRDLKAACRDVRNLKISETERRLDFPKGGMIAIRSTHNPDYLRGAGLDFAVLDEAAFMEPVVWPEIVRPMLLEKRGKALFLSSPNGLNWFWELYQLGLNKSQRTWRSFNFKSADNPLISPEELEALRLSTSERIFREEYLAEFIGDSGQVFRGIREAATAPLDAQPILGRRYAAGLDWGRETDYTVIVIMDADTRQMVAMDRFNQIGWSLQRGRLQAMIERWQPTSVWAEENSIGSVNIEALQQEGLPVRPFKTTAQSKTPLIEGLALAIERGEVALLPDETLLGELASYRMERLPAGGYRYSAPSGMHDDTVIATALAWHGVRQGAVLFDFI
jgi:phage terminase large subunit-like protein